MPTPRPEYRHGRIVWAYLRTAKGKREDPAVILTSNTAIIQPEKFDPRTGGENVVVVAGISTQYRNYPNAYVKLPFRSSPNGHPITGLRKDCAAIVGWYQAIFLADDITALSGDVPPAEMHVLNKKTLAHYVTTVGNQYATAAEMLEELRQELIEREFPSPE